MVSTARQLPVAQEIGLCVRTCLKSIIGRGFADESDRPLLQLSVLQPRARGQVPELTFAAQAVTHAASLPLRTTLTMPATSCADSLKGSQGSDAL
jgi:hypothetical protein